MCGWHPRAFYSPAPSKKMSPLGPSRGGLTGPRQEAASKQGGIGQEVGGKKRGGQGEAQRSPRGSKAERGRKQGGSGEGPIRHDSQLGGNYEGPFEKLCLGHEGLSLANSLL